MDKGFHKWPEILNVSECDDYRENYTWHDMISEKLLVGTVVFRIPLGWAHCAFYAELFWNIHNSSFNNYYINCRVCYSRICKQKG